MPPHFGQGIYIYIYIYIYISIPSTILHFIEKSFWKEKSFKVEALVRLLWLTTDQLLYMVKILWYGMAWHGMPCHGMIWYSIVWYSI